MCVDVLPRSCFAQSEQSTSAGKSMHVGQNPHPSQLKKAKSEPANKTAVTKKSANEEFENLKKARAAQTAAQAFESQREGWLLMFDHMQATSDNPRGAKLLDALRPIAKKYLKMPLKLVSQTDVGNSTALVFKASDPSTDLSWNCTATKIGSEWVITNLDFKGKNSVDVVTEPVNAIASVFPDEISKIMMGLTIFAFAFCAYMIASICLIVAAFKVSVLWGLVVLFVPFGNIIFAIVRWREAKIPFIVSLFCGALSLTCLAIPVSIVQSLKDVVKIMPTFVPQLTDEQTTQLIKKGLGNSGKLKLERLDVPSSFR